MRPSPSTITRAPLRTTCAGSACMESVTSSTRLLKRLTSMICPNRP